VEVTTHLGPTTPERPSPSDSLPEGQGDANRNADFFPDDPGHADATRKFRETLSAACGHHTANMSPHARTDELGSS